MIARLKHWLKNSDNPLAQRLFRMAKAVRGGSVPMVPGLHHALFAIHTGIARGVSELLRATYWTPLFKTQLAECGSALRLEGGMPQVLGPHLRIEVGNNVSMSAQMTINGRPQTRAPELIIGDNVVLGWLTGISVGRRIVIGDNVMFGGRNSLFGYSGHPLDAVARAAGEAESDAAVGDIIVGRNCWIGTGVIITGPATIGENTIVAAGSVVTSDLPANVLAGGVPARVIKTLS